MPERADILSAIGDPNALFAFSEQRAQEKIEDRIITQIFRHVGVQGGCLHILRKQAGGLFNFLWFNSESGFPAHLMARTVKGRSFFGDFKKEIMSKNFHKSNMLKRFQDVKDEEPDRDKIGLILRYNDCGRDLIMYTGGFTKRSPGEWLLSRELDGVVYRWTSLEHFLVAVSDEWDRTHLSTY